MKNGKNTVVQESALYRLVDSIYRSIVSWHNFNLLVFLGFCSIHFVITHMRVEGTVLDAPNRPPEFGIVEFAFHLGSFAFLTFFCLFAFTEPIADATPQARRSTAIRMVFWCLMILILAACDELSQPAFGRRLEAIDLLGNVFGVVVGQLSFLAFELSGWRRKLADYR